MEIKVNLADEKVEKVKDALSNLFPIPRNEDGSLKFTQEEWIIECLKNFTAVNLQRWEQAAAQRAAAQNIQLDTTLFI